MYFNSSHEIWRQLLKCGVCEGVGKGGANQASPTPGPSRGKGGTSQASPTPGPSRGKGGASQASPTPGPSRGKEWGAGVDPEIEERGGGAYLNMCWCSMHSCVWA